MAHMADAEVLDLRYAQAYSAAHSIFALPIDVAEQQGFFAREELHLQIVIPIPGGSDKMIAALHDDWADIAHVATPFLIRAAMNGSDAVAIDTEFKNPIYRLLAKPEIKSFADLRSKTIGLADPSGTITLSMLKLLSDHGLDQQSYGVKMIEGTPARWHCLHDGDCDAVVLGQPQDLLAVQEGYRSLGRSDQAGPEYLYTVTAVRRSWALAHREALIRFVRALAASFEYIRAPANRDSVVKLIAEKLHTSEWIAQQTIDLLLQPGRHVLPSRGEIDINAFNQVILMMNQVGLIRGALPKPQRFVDVQYLHAAGLQ